MFIRLSDNQYPLSEREIRDAFPTTSFAQPFAPDGYAVVFPTPQPTFDQYTQKCTELTPVLTVKGTWQQVWAVSDLAGEELAAGLERKRIDEIVPPLVVSPRQIRQALTTAGMRAAVEAGVAAADQNTQDWWEFATSIEENHLAILAMCAALGITDAQRHDVFVLAATL